MKTRAKSTILHTLMKINVLVTYIIIIIKLY